MSDLAFLPATELALRLRRRELSSVELLQHYLARIARLNPALNAVVVLDAERALQRARAADEALAHGEVWGPLHGLPMTVKESFDVPGLATTWGFEAQRGNIASRPAVAVQRLQQAGAVIFGKTNVPVNLADWQTFNPVYGTTHNPWDLSRTPGGSSGGSAAALAAGLTALELGSDIGASIRNPAHYCGVWGHKPTWGVVPQQGHQLPGTECIDALDIAAAGPLARSAHDLTLSMDILATPLRAFGPLGWVPAAWRDNGVPAPRLRVAVIDDDACAEVDASVRDQLRGLADFLRSRGLTVSEAGAAGGQRRGLGDLRAPVARGHRRTTRRRAIPAGACARGRPRQRQPRLRRLELARRDTVAPRLGAPRRCAQQAAPPVGDILRNLGSADLPRRHHAGLQTEPAGLSLATHGAGQRA